MRPKSNLLMRQTVCYALHMRQATQRKQSPRSKMFMQSPSRRPMYM
jgi:hypothetical protein